MSELNDLILIFSLDEGTIDLNKGIIEALGRPKQVQIRLDEKTKQMMLRACDIEEEQAVVVQEAEDAPQLGGRRLLKRIRNLAGWPDQQSRFVYGVFLPGYDAVLFNLLDAHPLSELPGMSE